MKYTSKLKRLEARCIFSEPQFEPKLLQTLTRNTQVRSRHTRPYRLLTCLPEPRPIFCCCATCSSVLLNA